MKTKIDLEKWVIKTFTGARFNLAAPDPALIRIQDIAHALANTALFNGQTHSYLSKAEFFVHVAQHADAEIAFPCLMQHCENAYLDYAAGNTAWTLPLDEIQAIRQILQSAFSDRFGLSYPLPWRCNVLKHRGLIDVAKQCADDRDIEVHRQLTGDSDGFGTKLLCLDPGSAESLFLESFTEFAPEGLVEKVCPELLEATYSTMAALLKGGL